MVVHVAPTDDSAGPNQNWGVAWEYATSAMDMRRRQISLHKTKQKAISEAKKFGRQKGDRQVIIHNKNGGSRTEWA